MNSKITLYSDKELIEQIKQYAKSRNTSVSKLVNEFFKNILEHKNSSNNVSITETLSGKLKGKNIKVDDYKKYLEEKYLWEFD